MESEDGIRVLFFLFSSRRRHTRLQGHWSSDVCSSDLSTQVYAAAGVDTTRVLRAFTTDLGVPINERLRSGPSPVELLPLRALRGEEELQNSHQAESLLRIRPAEAIHPADVPAPPDGAHAELAHVVSLEKILRPLAIPQVDERRVVLRHIAVQQVGRGIGGLKGDPVHVDKPIGILPDDLLGVIAQSAVYLRDPAGSHADLVQLVRQRHFGRILNPAFRHAQGQILAHALDFQEPLGLLLHHVRQFALVTKPRNEEAGPPGTDASHLVDHEAAVLLRAFQLPHHTLDMKPGAVLLGDLGASIHPQPVLLGELLQDGAKNDLLRAGIWAILAGLKHNDRIVRIFGSKDLTRDVAYKIHALACSFQSLHRQVLENRGIGEETAWEVYN